MSSFKCPECGSAEVASNLCVSTDWSITGKASDPWSYVLQQIHCANCDEYIPSHLGERWDNMSYESARNEWFNKYKR